MGRSSEKTIDAARSVLVNAYAPYSGFRVGAAVRGSDGNVYVGVNVENVSYGLTICAERAAVACAVAAGVRSLTEVVVATNADPPSAPCGACRQVLHEFGPEMTVIAVGPGGQRTWRLSELFPSAFGQSDLTE